MARPAPRSFVSSAESAAFGRALTLKWDSVTPGNQVELSAAYRQHVIACAVTAELRASGATREDLALRVGLSAETLRRKLRGETWMTFTEVSMLALGLGEGVVPVEPEDGPLPPARA